MIIILEGEYCKRLPHVQTYMSAENQRSAFSRKRNAHSPTQFHYFHNEERALCRRPLTALNMPQVFIRQPALLLYKTCDPGIKRRPSAKTTQRLFETVLYFTQLIDPQVAFVVKKTKPTPINAAASHF